MIFDLPENLATNTSNSWEEFEALDLKNILSSIEEGKFYTFRDNYNCYHIIENIAKELSDKKFGWQFTLRGLYLSFIILALRNIIPEPSSDIAENNQNVNLAVKITKYMHANYNKDITLESVAKAMYMTPRHINRIFDACFATTFSKTLSIFRLNYAKNYLFETDYSVEEIATLVGFSSARTLLKLFREVEGITTTEYRNMIRSSKHAP